MNVWTIILIAAILVLALKLVGYLVPQSLIEKPAPARVLGLLTVALLAALIAVQTLATGPQIVIDARVPAVIVAGALLALRAPFLVVVLAAALVAALLRLLGWAA